VPLQTSFIVINLSINFQLESRQFAIP